ncbi:hypothetical protein M758_12G153900 [Ceratodon purpureus]|nr:hypothetical protein M758_12G153900 [Ceratodon purpureus]
MQPLLAFPLHGSHHLSHDANPSHLTHPQITSTDTLSSQLKPSLSPSPTKTSKLPNFQTGPENHNLDLQLKSPNLTSFQTSENCTSKLPFSQHTPEVNFTGTEGKFPATTKASHHRSQPGTS